jgi:hypothetical protein
MACDIFVSEKHDDHFIPIVASVFTSASGTEMISMYQRAGQTETVKGCT